MSVLCFSSYDSNFRSKKHLQEKLTIQWLDTPDQLLLWGRSLNTHVYRPAPLRAPHEHRRAVYFLIELLLLCDWSDSVICGTNCCLIIKHWIRFILSVVTADLKHENITNIWGCNEFKSVVLSDPETPPPQHTPYLIGVGRADCTGPPADVPMVSTTNSLMLPSGTRAAFNMKSPICAQNCAKVLSHSSVLYALLLQRQTLWLFLKCCCNSSPGSCRWVTAALWSSSSELQRTAGEVTVSQVTVHFFPR